MIGTLLDMPREKRAPTTTIRVTERLAEEIEVIVDYLSSLNERPLTVASVLEEWCRPHIVKLKQKAIDYRIEKLRRMRER